jgi:hypothetical protein
MPRRSTAAEEAARRGKPATATTISIALTPAANASGAIRRCSGAARASGSAIYLDERAPTRATSASSSIAAEFFLARAPQPRGLRVLSNLAEMDLQNRQVLRLLAYRLQQAGRDGARRAVLERVARAGAERAAVASRSRPRARRRRPGAGAVDPCTGRRRAAWTAASPTST